MSSLDTHSTLIKFTDDLVMILRIDKSNEANKERLRHDLETITNFYKIYNFQINHNKSCCIILGNDDHSLDELLSEYQVIKSDTLTYLGFAMDCDLKLETRIDQIVRT